MKKVNFCKPFKTIAGEDLTDGIAVSLMKTVLANIIAGAKAKTDAVRQWEIALKISSAKGAMELEDADFDMIKSVLKESGGSVLIAGQLLKIIEEAEKKEKK